MAAEAEPRRLVLLFDGTWNKREHATNVWRFRLMLDESPNQLVYYDQGVGTDQFEQVRGGAFGTGLSRKVLSGYLWLMENYRPARDIPRRAADEVFVLGFSRGAFTARSLVGFLNLCGLMRSAAPVSVVRTFELSREDRMERRHLTPFRRQNSDEIRIKFLGVWDTVGALGVSKLDLPFLERYRYHKAEGLPPIVDHARHAMALDERRKIFKAILWPGMGPGNLSLEQRWFCGAHANVGGGYEQDGLFLRPLQWMIGEAAASGLRFSSRLPTLARFYDSLPRDSLNEVMLGAYRLTQWGPHDRTVTFNGATHETLDYTVLQRWLWFVDYCPPCLSGYLGIKPAVQAHSARLTTQQILNLVPNVRLSPLYPDAFVC